MSTSLAVVRKVSWSDGGTKIISKSYNKLRGGGETIEWDAVSGAIESFTEH